MQYSAWDAAKDFLGMLGSVLIAVPWLRDFFLRQRRAEVSKVATADKLSQLRDRIVASIREKTDNPKMADFVLTVLGLLCIFASFSIAFFRGLAS